MTKGTRKTSPLSGGTEEGIGRSCTSIPTAETPITRGASTVAERKTMTILKINDSWYRLDVGYNEEALTFFGYSREHVKHKFDAWVRTHDVSKL